MKKLLTLLVLSFTMTLPTYAAQSLDKVVAVINDEVITSSELNHSIEMVKLQISQQNIAAPSDDILKKQVLDQLINKHLQLQLAKQAGIKVTDSDLNKTIGNIAKQNNVSTATLYERLAEDGMDVGEYKREIRDQIAIHKIQQQEIVNRVGVSPDEISSFIRSQTWQTKVPNEYHLEDILIPLSDTPNANEIANAKSQAQSVANELKQGSSVDTITQTASNNKQEVQGGDLGWRGLSEIPSAFAELVSRMNPKEVAGPIQTSNGFHVIRLAEVRAAGKPQAAPSRKEVEEMLLQKKYEEAIQTWLSKLRAQAFIVTDVTKKHALA